MLWTHDKHRESSHLQLKYCDGYIKIASLVGIEGRFRSNDVIVPCWLPIPPNRHGVYLSKIWFIDADVIPQMVQIKLKFSHQLQDVPIKGMNQVNSVKV